MGWSPFKEKGCKDLVYSAKYLNFKANVFILGMVMNLLK